MNHPWPEILKLLTDISMLQGLRERARAAGTNYILFDPAKHAEQEGYLDAYRAFTRKERDQ